MGLFSRAISFGFAVSLLGAGFAMTSPGHAQGNANLDTLAATICNGTPGWRDEARSWLRESYPNREETGYRNAWIAIQVIGLIALFGALTELTNRILEHYPGLRRVTTSGLFGLLLATAIVAAAGESVDKPVRLVLMMLGGWNAATGVYVT